MLNTSPKIVLDYKALVELIDAHRALNKKIVCTIGSWDMLHIGHVRYLARAKRLGDILLVGADSDRAIKIYKKNPLRPVIPQEERMEMLSYQSFVDYVTLVDDVDKEGRWQLKLLQLVRPDVFVATTKESYPEKQKREIAKFCGCLKILKRQAKGTSTTKIIEKTVKEHFEYFLRNTKI